MFLDEIGEINASVQTKLLRVLQEREIQRVGGEETVKVDVRVVTATNKDLGAEVKAGKFREDLYYRLNVVTLTMPSLRERREDIARLATHLLEKFVRQYDRPARRFGEAATSLLVAYDWPGNLRELRNVVERAVILCQGEAVGPEHLPFSNNARGLGGGLRVGDPVSLQELEQAHIQALLAISPTMESAARTLGIDSSTLYRKRKQYNMP